MNVSDITNERLKQALVRCNPEQLLTQLCTEPELTPEELRECGMPVFNREIRYWVLKDKDVRACLSEKEQTALAKLAWKVSSYRADKGKPELDCVVIESDWPEYETAWKMLEDRATKQTIKAEPVVAEIRSCENLIRQCDQCWYFYDRCPDGADNSLRDCKHWKNPEPNPQTAGEVAIAETPAHMRKVLDSILKWSMDITERIEKVEDAVNKLREWK